MVLHLRSLIIMIERQDTSIMLKLFPEDLADVLRHRVFARPHRQAIHLKGGQICYDVMSHVHVL